MAQAEVETVRVEPDADRLERLNPPGGLGATVFTATSGWTGWREPRS